MSGGSSEKISDPCWRSQSESPKHCVTRTTWCGSQPEKNLQNSIIWKYDNICDQKVLHRANKTNTGTRTKLSNTFYQCFEGHRFVYLLCKKILQDKPHADQKRVPVFVIIYFVNISYIVVGFLIIRRKLSCLVWSILLPVMDLMKQLLIHFVFSCQSLKRKS